MTADKSFNTDPTPYHNLLSILWYSFNFSTRIQRPTSNCITKQLIACFIGKYCSTPVIIFMLNCPLNTCIFCVLVSALEYHVVKYLCGLIFRIEIFVIRDMAAGDRSPFCQKCKMTERFVFIIFEFRCEHIFIQKKGCFK